MANGNGSNQAVAPKGGMDLIEATQFASAIAGISVTRPGTAPSMPHRPEIDAIRVATPASI
jgi:ribokinase